MVNRLGGHLDEVTTPQLLAALLADQILGQVAHWVWVMLHSAELLGAQVGELAGSVAVVDFEFVSRLLATMELGSDFDWAVFIGHFHLAQAGPLRLRVSLFVFYSGIIISLNYNWLLLSVDEVMMLFFVVDEVDW